MQHTSSAEYITFIFNELIMRKRGCKAHLNADLRNGEKDENEKQNDGRRAAHSNNFSLSCRRKSSKWKIS